MRHLADWFLTGDERGNDTTRINRRHEDGTAGLDGVTTERPHLVVRSTHGVGKSAGHFGDVPVV
jgi:hypothetical protein